MTSVIDSKKVSWAPTIASMVSTSGSQSLSLAPSSDDFEKRENAGSSPVVSLWNEAQSSALLSLARAVDESSVFAAVVGPNGSGTSDVLARLLLISKQKKRMCIAIPAPHKVLGKTIDNIAERIVTVVRSLPTRSIHILFGIDNAHTATDELLSLLNHFARSRDCLGAPQVVLAGEPELWNRLASSRYESLRRRLALRCSLESQLH